MNKIELTCPCGAAASFEDQRGTYIYPGGDPDAKQRRFLIEVRADDWLERHQACINKEKNDG